MGNSEENPHCLDYYHPRCRGGGSPALFYHPTAILKKQEEGKSFEKTGLRSLEAVLELNRSFLKSWAADYAKHGSQSEAGAGPIIEPSTHPPRICAALIDPIRDVFQTSTMTVVGDTVTNTLRERQWESLLHLNFSPLVSLTIHAGDHAVQIDKSPEPLSFTLTISKYRLNTLGQFLRKPRLDKGLERRLLARKPRVHKNTVYERESDRKGLSKKSMERLRRVFKVRRKTLEDFRMDRKASERAAV